MGEVFIVAVVNGQWRGAVVVDVNREVHVVRFFWRVGFGGGDVHVKMNLLSILALSI